MPLFKCPHCGKRYVISLAMCESFLESTPISQPEDGIDCLYVSPCPGCSAGKIEVVDGDLLEQDVDAIVNSWNRNVIPLSLFLPHGVSRAIQKRSGMEPFQELQRHGPIPLGGGGGHLGWQIALQGDYSRCRD